MRHTISVLVENKFGVLTRVAGLFSGRGYNIDTLNVAPTHDLTASRMTIITRGDDATLEQIVKQLNKLADVIKVIDFREGDYLVFGRETKGLPESFLLSHPDDCLTIPMAPETRSLNLATAVAIILFEGVR